MQEPLKRVGKKRDGLISESGDHASEPAKAARHFLARR
jgi:hypothetical protein